MLFPYISSIPQHAVVADGMMNWPIECAIIGKSGTAKFPMRIDQDRVRSLSEIVFNNIIGEQSILLSLRSGSGINEHVYLETVEVCRELCLLLANQTFVPKKLAQCFVDLSNAVYASEGLYTEEAFEGLEDKVQELNYWGQELFESQPIETPSLGDGDK